MAADRCAAPLRRFVPRGHPVRATAGDRENGPVSIAPGRGGLARDDRAEHVREDRDQAVAEARIVAAVDAELAMLGDDLTRSQGAARSDDLLAPLDQHLDQ